MAENKFFFVSDLHGRVSRYEKLLKEIIEKRPTGVFIGGDLSPTGLSHFTNLQLEYENFITDFMIEKFSEIKMFLGNDYPAIFIIMGNDDARIEEKYLREGEEMGLWKYIQGKIVEYDRYRIIGYSFIPPSPFHLKDWEKYDVSRYVDPGCISPEEGARSLILDTNHIKYGTIQKDLKKLLGSEDLSNAIFLFHAPPYQTKLDRANLDGKKVDHAPLDVHIGSIAIKKLIEERQPLLTLHGHVHESSRMTGQWRDEIGNTVCFNAAIDDKLLSVIKFNPENLTNAERILI